MCSSKTKFVYSAAAALNEIKFGYVLLGELAVLSNLCGVPLKTLNLYYLTISLITGLKQLNVHYKKTLSHKPIRRIQLHHIVPTWYDGVFVIEDVYVTCCAEFS